MRILHYSLGVPGFRSGGLTKYSIDLMNAEAELGHDVFLIYPGEIRTTKKKIIKKDKKYNKINVYELINPLPIPLTSGVAQPKLYYQSTKEEKEYFKNWILKEKFDVMHIHTLMGLPMEFVDSVKELGIKILFTTHDYYGICPKVNFVKIDGSICTTNNNYLECYNCCKNGLSYNKIKIMQSKLYRYVKDNKYGNKIIRLIKSNINKDALNIDSTIVKEKYDIPDTIEKEYKCLQNYYYNLFKKIDCFHFNSDISKKVYSNYLGSLNGYIIPITHSDIRDNRKIKSYNDKRLRVVFLGNDTIHKGLRVLIKALKSIDSSLEEFWSLTIWGVSGESDCDNITYMGKYDYKMLEYIFSNADLIVIPSIWYETFGFIGLEAYSYGVPVLSTDLVGFNCIIDDGKTGFIVEHKLENLKDGILHLIKNRDSLIEVNKNICKDDFLLTMNNHVLNILNLYERL